MASVELKVLSLNCLDVCIPTSCKHRARRIEAIANELAKGEYDIVLLQEIWSDRDYNKICEATATSLPYSHYFYSGYIGSGVCIFSKYAIYDTYQHSFTLNGYPHRVFCGDWYCGKSVTLARILVNDFRVNVYSSHMHAQYYDPDDYEAHRIAQSFELAQFVRETSENCDFVLVGGDFNYRPEQLGYRVIRSLANLDDSWLTRKNSSGEGCSYELTCDRPENSFCTPSLHHPKGVTLDYIMYRQHAGCSVTCDQCSLAMREIPGENFQYSDHEGVCATFTIRRNVTAAGRERDSVEIEKALTDMLPVLDSGAQRCASSRLFFLTLAILSLVMHVFLTRLDLAAYCPLTFCMFSFLLALVFFYSLFYILVWTGRELRALKACRANVSAAIKGLHVD